MILQKVDTRKIYPLLITLMFMLAACSGGSGEAVKSNLDLVPGNASSRSLVLSGPPPQTDDVQRFRIQLWENIAADNRCGQCHGVNGQSPNFARNDNINTAYDQANPLVNLDQPGISRMVAKVGGGHNCWLDSDQACADILTTWISNWAGESTGSTNRVALVAPTLRDPGDSKSFPADSTDFAATIHPLLQTYCAGCHVDNAAVPQSPFFAAADPTAAYAAVRNKIEVDDPASSRLVVRLGSEFHNCWSDCTQNAQTMFTAVQAFVDGIPETAVDPNLVTSKAIGLIDGVVASGGGRYDANIIALYQFKTLTGQTAFDTSGVDPALNLSFSGDVDWVGGWGVRIGDAGKLQGTTTNSAKLHNLITSTGEYSVEGWVVPGNVTQEEVRIASYSGGNTVRNFSLGQTLYNYDFLARSSETSTNGDPAISTPDADELLQATLQHVVATYDPTNGSQIFVNGTRIEAESAVESAIGGNLNDWDDTFAFVLGNEVTSNSTFRGILKLIAIHNRALTPAQILQNFEAGVGERFFLLFGISHLIDIDDAFIVFEVSQFDSYSYLFSGPIFISLSQQVLPQGIELEGMRIGINGREPDVGQAYAKLNLSLGDDTYDPETGQVLSAIGTIFGIEKGTESDDFFLTFEQLGNFQNVRVEPAFSATPVVDAVEFSPTIGVRIFSEINASLAAITGVPMTHPDVQETFNLVRQQLPANVNIEGFLSSQQMAVTQIAIEYCNALIENTTLRTSRFPAFNFSDLSNAAFSVANRTDYLDPLIDLGLGTDIATQPDRNATRLELDSLVSTLLASGENTADRTLTIAKASCAAVLGSATTLVQ